MLFAKKALYIPEYWRHDPSLQSASGYTVAMIYATCDEKHELVG